MSTRECMISSKESERVMESVGELEEWPNTRHIRNGCRYRGVLKKHQRGLLPDGVIGEIRSIFCAKRWWLEKGMWRAETVEDQGTRRTPCGMHQYDQTRFSFNFRANYLEYTRRKRGRVWLHTTGRRQQRVFATPIDMTIL